MATLFTNGLTVTKTIAEFEAFASIRYSKTDFYTYTRLIVSDSGSLNLAAQLGPQNAIIAMQLGSNALTTGDGNDWLYSGNGNDSIYGGRGNDLLSSGLGDDLLFGGDGDNSFHPGVMPPSPGAYVDSSVSGGRDTIYGGAGGDTLSVAASHYADLTLFGGAGRDHVQFLSETERAHTIKIDASQSIEQVSGLVWGSDADDSFDFGTASLDATMVVHGGMGNDLIYAHFGAGTFWGEEGNDTIYAGDGGAYLNGWTGADELYGGAGNDTLLMFLDGDLVFGGGGSDLVRIVAGSGTVRNLDLTQIMTWAATIEIVYLGSFGRSFTGTKGANLINFGGGSAVDMGVLLDGAAGSDTLVGTGRADTVIGGSGADSMVGSAGDDDYVVDDAGDIVVELAGEGKDSISTSVFGFHIVDNVEKLYLGGNGAQLAYGGDGNDIIWATFGLTNVTLFGGAGDDVLWGGVHANFDGGAGNDTLSALKGAGTLKGGDGDDALTGDLRGDRLLGGSGNDTLVGGEGNDALYGGDGIDVLTGGLGDDLYLLTLGDTISADTGGNDTVMADVLDWTMTLGIEVFVSTATAGVHVVGNFLVNTITTTRFADTLEGTGIDILSGGKGDDTYILTDTTGHILENPGGGTDTVVLNLPYGYTGNWNYTLPDNVEVLDYTIFNAPQLRVDGNALNNRITLDHYADDTINGGAGNDTMNGAEGDDTYIVDSTGDVIRDSGTSAKDWVIVYLPVWVLGAGTENLVQGLAVDSTLTGNRAGNVIAGHDGDDVISGGAGDDDLIGLNGHDSLTGGQGADHFAFGLTALTNSADTIADFEHGKDQIYLASSHDGAFGALALDQLGRDEFKLLGSARVDATDRILYNQTTGVLFYDADGLGGQDAVRIATIANHAELSARDFWVV